MTDPRWETVRDFVEEPVGWANENTDRKQDASLAALRSLQADYERIEYDNRRMLVSDYKAMEDALRLNMERLEDEGYSERFGERDPLEVGRAALRRVKGEPE